MALTATAKRMMDTLPFYYHGEPLIERIVQADANEIDRLDELLDQIVVELQPGAATDELGLLELWELSVGLPMEPAGASVSQRQAKLRASLQSLDSGSAADTLAIIAAAMDGGAFTVERDTPGLLSDTITIPYESGSYNAAVIESLLRRAWPAHRLLFMRYEGGFLLDVSRLDEDVM